MHVHYSNEQAGMTMKTSPGSVAIPDVGRESDDADKSMPASRVTGAASGTLA
ncbi:hypothetical protein AWB81_08048 [Caballeronia arationis]|nr:hypothetical protein AWB81_08048 [Caballeronia arationis]